MQQSSGGINFVTTSSTNVITTTSATIYQNSQILSSVTTRTTPIASPITLTSFPQCGQQYISPPYSIQTETSNITQNTNQDLGITEISHQETLPWQIVSPRRSTKRRIGENEIQNQSTKKSNTNNRFTVLENYDIPQSSEQSNEEQRRPEEIHHSEKKTSSKPPPIYVQDVVNFPHMIESITTVLPTSEFICKTQANNTVKINTLTIDAYRKIVHFFKQNSISHYTFQPRSERAYRVVIKNLHYSIETEDIKNALQEKGFEIRNVVNIRSWKNKEPLPMFFVDQEPNDNNKKIYEIIYLLGTKITVEPPRKKSQTPQCLRCQEYGHTRRYCSKPYYCVKCAESHPTSDCSKNRNTPAKCVLCLGPHPANYKGCSVYRDLQLARNKSVHQLDANMKTPENNLPSKKTSDKISYAHATKPHNNITSNITQDTHDTTLTQFLNKFEMMFNQLMTQNTMIINLLTKLVNN